MPAMPIAAPRSFEVRSLRLLPKSWAMLEPIALMRESAVEIIATRTADPIRAVRIGFVMVVIKVMRTLAPGAIGRLAALASMPKRMGIVQISMVAIPAKIAAFVTVFGDFVARQR